MAQQYLLSIIHALYIIISILLNLYSINILILTVLFWWGRLRRKKIPPTVSVFSPDVDWPLVAIQLPLYNEKEIALRIIDQVIKLDYPVKCLHIQVLDDSNDETEQLVAERVAHYQAQGIWITHQHRSDRKEYKAGALKEGLRNTPADLVAVFDADFMPPPNWLKRAISPFMKSGTERLGFVQTRWTHLNDRFSLLTNAQALLLDAHFGIEQPVCYQNGLVNYLNGTGFILRRACIEEAGNWCGDTLVEDLDLCLRAQICGWKAVFLQDVCAPAELPGLISGFKNQQYRWAKGSMQTIRRQTWRLIRSPLPILKRLEALMHLFSYLVHPLVLLLLILALPLYTWSSAWLVKLPLNSLGVIGIAIPIFYISAHFTTYPLRRWKEILLRLPALSLIGLGIAINNTLGVLDGMGKGPAVFERTPKLGTLEHHRLDYKEVKEPLKISRSIWLEVIFAFYALFATVTTLKAEHYLAAYFFALYTFSFCWVAVTELIENRIAARNAR